MTGRKHAEVLKALQRSHNLIREIAKEVINGQSLIRKCLSNYSKDEVAVITIILESISETPIPFNGQYRGMIHIFRVWYMNDAELVILTNSMAASPSPTLIDLEHWFECFLDSE